jgi:hypothetical protein
VSGSNYLAALAPRPRNSLLDAVDPVTALWHSLPDQGGGNALRQAALTNPGVNVREAEYLAGMPAAPGTRNALSQMANLYSGFAGTAGPGRLPMDAASRAARAAEQGYTINAFKGMNGYSGGPSRNWRGEILEDAPYHTITEFRSPSGQYAGFFSDSPDVANRFSSIYTHGNATFPARLRFDNPVVIDAGGKPAAAFQFEDIARKHGTLEEMRRFRSAFANGTQHDGVILRNTADEGTVYVPRTPQQARSRFAAFDPARLNEPDMLASAAAAGLLGVGGAASMSGDRQ